MMSTGWESAQDDKLGEARYSIFNDQKNNRHSSIDIRHS